MFIYTSFQDESVKEFKAEDKKQQMNVSLINMIWRTAIRNCGSHTQDATEHFVADSDDSAADYSFSLSTGKASL